MKTPRLLVEKVPTVNVCWVHRLTGILWSKNTISWSLGRKSSGQKDRNYLLRNRAVIDLGVCLGVKALFQPLPPCFDPARYNSPHGVSSRQFNFEPLETLSTYHVIEPVKDALYGTT